ncbi:globin-coupled histidine kinase [bacterium MnTg02]|nr:globin-coupled histidine kinase [bacterium MnTg02]
MLILPFVMIFYAQPELLSEWVSFVHDPEQESGFNYLHFGAATGVLFSLIVQIGEQVDYLRFLPDKTEENRVSWWTAMISAGPGWILIGGLKILAGSFLAVLAVRAGVSYVDAVEPIHMYIEAYQYVSDDPWIVLTAATVFVIISQVKINVTNAYAGSLAWSNFYSRVTHYHPGRVVWLVFNILISLLLMLLGIFETLQFVLTVYSNVAIAWIGAIFADLVVLKPMKISPSFIEFKRAHLYNINPVGCGAMLIASTISVTAFSGVFGEVAQAYSAIISLVTAFTAAIAIGMATKGKYYIAREDTFADRVRGQETIGCGVCDYNYEPQDMAYCPYYEGPICSLCCSLDAHCHDICKHPFIEHHEGLPIVGDRSFRRRIPPDLTQRLAKFLGVFLALAVVTAAVFLLAYRMIDLDQMIEQTDNARLLFRIYSATLVLICIGAWWIVLAHESRELAERELVTSLEILNETRNELMQSEQLATIGQVTATVSHELRNPLGTISSSASVLSRYLENSDPEVREELDRMQRNIRRCVHIIEDLLDFSRYREMVVSPVLMDELIRSLLEEQRLPAAVSLKTALNSEATVLVDNEKFRQVFVNVIQNANQAMMQSDDPDSAYGELAVATRVVKNRFELSVSDQGAGIPLDAREKIFKPLFSTKAFGIGLGMPLVKRIVEQHNGGVDIASEWGKGTTVTIWLPLAER